MTVELTMFINDGKHGVLKYTQIRTVYHRYG